MINPFLCRHCLLPTMYLAETTLNKNLEQYKLDVENFDLYYIKNWLDDDLRLQVKDLIDKHAFPSTITTQGSTKESDFRTSSTYYFNFNPHNRDYIELQRRITETMGIPEEYSEPLQGVKYEVGEYFKEHTDFFDRRSPNFEVFAQGENQRTWTFMVYLNDVEEGGHTLFPQIKLQFKPVAGSALIWNNLWPDGKENYWTSHEALPPVSGQKFIATQWYRMKPYRAEGS